MFVELLNAAHSPACVISCGLIVLVLTVIHTILIRRRAVVMRGEALALRDKLSHALARQANDLERYENLFHVTPSGIFTVNTDRVITSWNRMAEHLTGYPANEMVGKCCEAFCLTPCKQGCGLFSEAVQKPLFGKEATIRSKDGSTLNISKSIALLHDDQGKVVGGVESFIDVSELHRLNREKSLSEAKLLHAEKLASIGTMAAGIAHEINNPLAIIKGSLDVIQRIDHPERRQTALTTAQASVKRITDIVNSMRTLVRADGNLSYPVDLHTTIAETVPLVESIFRKSGITIARELNHPGATFHGNVGKLQQILLNLITNARDAMEHTGKEGIITISTEGDADTLRLHIRDNGSGMTPETLKSIFDPFFTTKPVGRGTGLGLAICYEIVAGFKGTVEVQSTLGIGTEFIITLPVHHVNAVVDPKASVKTVVQPLSTVNTTALVIDDDSAMRFILRECLANSGITIEEADDGDTALELLRNKHYDFVLCDIRMPRMSGDLLLEMAENIPASVGTKFIIISGTILTDIDQKARERIKRLAYKYLLKPVDENVLLAAIQDGVAENAVIQRQEQLAVPMPMSANQR